MRVTNLKVTNLRVLDHMEFEFNPQVNLIVGVNGVGKTTILDALRICSSRILPSITKSKSKAMSFSIDDTRSGTPFLEVELSFEHDHHSFRYARRQWREQFSVDDEQNIERLKREIRESVRLRDRTRKMLRELDESHSVSDTDFFIPSLKELKKSAKISDGAPNCVFFSTNRSVVSDKRTSKSQAAGGEATAYARALNPRPLFLTQFADWMRVQGELASELRRAAQHLEALRLAASRFLPNYENLRSNHDDGPRLLIDKNGVTLDVRQLSDGERGQLALVLDLARRLSQANPNLDDPLRDGEAIVLIDEIDLHLHPKWQRQIVRNLTVAFPKCQFIATTHSPQVIGEVEHGRIQIMAEGEVYAPSHSFGVDSSRVLEEIMNTRPRTKDVQDLLAKLSRASSENDLKQAQNILNELAGQLGEDDPEVTRARILLEFLEDNE